MPPNEAERLRAVYHGYRKSQTVQARWSAANPGNRAIVRERTRALAHVLRAAGLFPLTQRRILDVGCGSGQVLASLTQWGAVPDRLYGVDLLSDRIRSARQQFPDIRFCRANAERLGFPDGTFDLALLFTVFTSILDDRMARNVAQEVERVLRPGGAVVWYDFRYDNPRNPNVRGMTRAAIHTLFVGFELQLQSQGVRHVRVQTEHLGLPNSSCRV